MEGTSSLDARTGDNCHHGERSQSGPASVGNPPTTKPRKALLKSFITLSSAEVREEDMRIQLQYARRTDELYGELDVQKERHPKPGGLALRIGQPRPRPSARYDRFNQQTGMDSRELQRVYSGISPRGVFINRKDGAEAPFAI